MILPGTEYLSQSMHVVAQSFYIPTMVGLLYYILAALRHLGGLVAELQARRAWRAKDYDSLLDTMLAGSPAEWRLKIENSTMLGEMKEWFFKALAARNQGRLNRKIIGERLMAEREQATVKNLEKTETIARMGPVLGLMGTLIPLGPGLAALSAGDLQTLSQAITVAFDTTVAGVGAGWIAFIISKVRRRWYEDELQRLDNFLQVILGGDEVVLPTGKAVGYGGRD